MLPESLENRVKQKSFIRRPSKDDGGKTFIFSESFWFIDEVRVLLN